MHGKGISIHIQTPEGKRKTTPIVCNEPWKYEYQLTCLFFMESALNALVSYPEIGAPLLDALLRINDHKTISHQSHDLLKVCQTKRRLFYDTIFKKYSYFQGSLQRRPCFFSGRQTFECG